MTIVVRTFSVTASPEEVLGYLIDLGNAPEWHAATRHSTRTGTGPIDVGATWQNVSRVRGVTTELRYTLTAAGPDRLVFLGRNEGVTATDTVTVRPVAGGTEVTIHVDVEMHGLAKLATPVMRAEFERLGDETAARLTEVLNRRRSAA